LHRLSFVRENCWKVICGRFLDPHMPVEKKQFNNGNFIHMCMCVDSALSRYELVVGYVMYNVVVRM